MWAVMAVQKAQAGVLINRLHYALPGWGGAEGRPGAQEGLYESAKRVRRRRRGSSQAVWSLEFAHLDFDDVARQVIGSR
jgi:hypothetical protein